MSRTYQLAILAMVIAVHTGSARANWVDGNELHDYCNHNYAKALMYVWGAVDALDYSYKLNGKDSPICSMHDVKRDQLLNKVCDFLQYAPDRDKRASYYVNEAVERHFRCKWP